jgi:hypothetical protein
MHHFAFPMSILYFFIILLTSDVIAIGSGTGTAAEDVRSQIVDLLAVFVSNDGASSGTSISSQYNAILQNEFITFSRTL